MANSIDFNELPIDQQIVLLSDICTYLNNQVCDALLPTDDSLFLDGQVMDIETPFDFGSGISTSDVFDQF